MQIPKEEIRKIIVEKAMEEFIARGFKDASMRVIARNANVGLSNIYNYFRNKDELFTEVLSPTIAAVEKMIKEHNGESNLTTDFFHSPQMQQTELARMVNLIETYRWGLQLLLFKSAGSSFENFRETVTEKSMKMGYEYLMKMKEKYPKISADVSPFFIHFMSSMWLTIMSEIITHELTHEQIIRFISEYIEFGTAGWQKLMKV